MAAFLPLVTFCGLLLFAAFAMRVLLTQRSDATLDDAASALAKVIRSLWPRR